MADSSFFTDGGSGSGTFQTIETKIAEAEAAKVAAQAAQAAAEQAETDAQTAESQAVAAKNAAELAQAGATGSETNSASSATTAGNHAADALKLATQPEDSQFTLSDGSTTGYSALHYSEKASDSASAAALSAGTATTKAGEASNSAQTALQAQSAAESARDSALSALDNFEDQYLGDHSSDPTTDGDGDPLAAGMIYYNTTDSVVKVYSGSAWVVAYADGTTLVAKAGDTMTGNLTVNANIDANSLNVDSGTLVVDGSTNRVGINLGSGVSPTVPLNVAGTVRFQSTSSAGQTLEFTNYSGYSQLYRSNGHLQFQGGNTGNGILQLSNSGGFTFDGNNVWHAGNLDSILDLGITDGTSGQVLQTDGAGGMSFTTITGFSGAFADLSGKPTTISGYGITDAFDGAYSSLTGTPSIPTNNNQLTNGAGYITSADGGNAATLDGIDSSSFLRSDADDTVSADITFSDGNKAIFGDDADISIYHSGSSNLIHSKSDLTVGKGVTGGSFKFILGQPSGAGGNTLEIQSNSTGGHQRINAASTNYPLELQYNGGTKLSIDSNGVDTFGTLVNDGHLLVVNNGVSNQGDNNTHFNYQDTGVNYIRGTLTYSNSPFRIASGGIQRSAHNNGHLEGGYNNIGANSTNTNPIFTIGSNYNPNSTSLNNMYGIGYTHTNASFIGFAGTSGWGMYVASDGDARVYLSGQQGSGHFTGNITAYASDERLKTNITTIDNALDKVCQLRGVEYDWVDNITSEYDFHPSSMHETGVIAQDVQKVIPDAVCEAPMNANYTAKSGENHEFLTVDKEKIIPVLIEAIKELKAEIEELKKG